MGDLTSFITIAASNSFMFTNSSNNDMLIYTESYVQNILMGTQSNQPALLMMNSNTITVGADIIPISDSIYNLGSSNMRYKDLYLSGNTLDIGGIKITKDMITGYLNISNSNSNQTLSTNAIQIGNNSNIVIISIDSNTNMIQFVNNTLSNGQIVSSNVTSIGGWSNTGRNSLALIGSNVGIGKSNPNSLLDVAGDINFDGILRQGGVAYIGSQWSNNNSNIYIFGSNVGININNPSEALEIGGFNAKVGCNLYVMSNIGIRTSNPNYPLDVTGDMNFTGTLHQNGIPYVQSQWSRTNDSNSVYILNENIGVGLSNPTSAFTVAGDAEFRSNISLANNILVFRGLKILKNSNNNPTTNITTTVYAVPGYSHLSNNSTFSIGTSSNNYVNFTGSNELARFTGDGKLGLGTSNPLYTLDVAGSVNAFTYCNLLINSMSNNSMYNAPTCFVLSNVYSMSLFGSNMAASASNRTFNSWANYSSNLYVIGSNVAIGTSNAGSLLACAGNATIGSAYSNVSAPSNSLIVQSNIGVGTSNPTQALDVVGNINCSGNISAGNLGMFRNRIINGDMRIDQRNNGSNVTNANGYIIDRMLTGATGNGKLNAGQSNINFALNGFQYAYTVAVGTTTSTINAGDSYRLIYQAIEGYNVSDLQFGTANAQPISVSFWYYSSTINTYYLSLDNGSISYVTSFITSANTWQYFTFLISGDTTGTWNYSKSIGLRATISAMVGSTFSTSSSNTWLNGEYFGLTGNTNTFMNTPGAYVMITGLQLEKGIITTPFEYRPYQIEYQLCQRYCTAYISNGNSQRMFQAIAFSGGGISAFITFPVMMRSSPILISNFIPAQITGNNAGEGLAIAASSGFTLDSNDVCNVSATIFATTTTTQSYNVPCYINPSSAGYYVRFESEI